MKKEVIWQLLGKRIGLLAFTFFLPLFVIGAPVIPESHTAAYQTMLTSSNPNERFYGELAQELMKPANYVTSFDALKTFVVNFAQTKNFTTRWAINQSIARAAITLYKDDPAVNCPEAYAFMKQYNVIPCACQYLNANYGRFDNAKLFDEYLIVIGRAGLNSAKSNLYKTAVSNFIRLCSEVDSVKAKEGLQALNRKLSPRLLQNKTDWEPIIVQIRVALETY